MEKSLTKETALAYRQYNEIGNSNEHFDLLISNPEKTSENEYKCLYSIIGKKVNITFPVYSNDKFQVLLLAIFNAYTTAIANNLNPTFDKNDKEEDHGLKKFCSNFKKYIQPKIALNNINFNKDLTFIKTNTPLTNKDNRFVYKEFEVIANNDLNMKIKFFISKPTISSTKTYYSCDCDIIGPKEIVLSQQINGHDSIQVLELAISYVFDLIDIHVEEFISLQNNHST